MKKKIKGTPIKPRLYIFKSNKHIYAQIIDDTNHKVITSSSTISKDIRDSISSCNCKTASKVGKDIAEKSKQQGITQVIFDRGRSIYHGKIKALADAAREEGIIF